MADLCQDQGKKNNDSPALWIPRSHDSPVSKAQGSCDFLVSKVQRSHFESAITLWKSKKKIIRPMDISNGARINWLMKKLGAKNLEIVPLNPSRQISFKMRKVWRWEGVVVMVILVTFLSILSIGRLPLGTGTGHPPLHWEVTFRHRYWSPSSPLGGYL